MNQCCQKSQSQNPIDREELEADLYSLHNQFHHALNGICSDEKKFQMVALIEMGKIAELLNYLVDVKYKFDEKYSEK